MFNRLLKSIMLVCALAFTCAVLPAAGNSVVNVASAQDVWVYGTDDGTSYWVRDETVVVRRKTAVPWQATLKTVRNNTCVDQTTWYFSADEGYVFASKSASGNNGFAIYASYQNAGGARVYNRPELLALYNWIVNNY